MIPAIRDQFTYLDTETYPIERVADYLALHDLRIDSQTDDSAHVYDAARATLSALGFAPF